MRPTINFGCCTILLLALATELLVSCSELKPSNTDEAALRQLAEDERQLSPEQLSDMMEKFGQEIGDLMSENIEKMLQNQVDQENSRKVKKDSNSEELERIKRANEMIAKDAESRIAAAGKAATGELAEFSLSDAYANGKDFFVNKVNVRLQQAGSYIGGQMSSLANMAPTLKENLRKAPSALRKILGWPTFFNFKVKFNKIYKNRVAELYRQMVFLKTQTITGIHNMKFFFGKTRHLQTTTQYADLTEEEYLEQTGNDAKLADALDENKQDGMSGQQLAKLRQLQRNHRSIYGGDMGKLLEKSRETSPAEVMKRKHQQSSATRRRRKRDSSELDDEDEEGPVYSFSAFSGETEDDGDDDGSDDDGSDEDEDEDEDEGGNQEAELIDNFATGFQHVDLDARMEAELDDGPEENWLDGEDGEENFEPIDWSQHKCMPKIENQENCGFCYALVASALTEFYNCMWNLKEDPESRPRRLSARFVSDCGRFMYDPPRAPLIDGCQGGIIGQAVKFIREAGTMTFFRYENQRVAIGADYSYDKCYFPRPAAIKDWAPIRAHYLQETSLISVPRDDWATVNLFLHTAGPVVLNIRPWLGFKNYAGGVFDELQVLPETGKVHSVLIVGRDRDHQGRVYYKLRNTHGIPWGERGYFRVEASVLKHYSTIKGILMPTEAEQQQ